MDFTETQRARDLLAQHGAVEAQPAREWAGTFALPSELEEFYRDVGPVNVSVPGYGNSSFLPRLSALWEHQVGYRFHGHSGERLADWDDDWIVIGDVGADPYIYSRRTKTVLFARHGEGAWDPEPLYRSPITMVACVALSGRVKSGHTWTGQNRPTGDRVETVRFYLAAS